jgi:hypothetical protein
VVARRGGSSRRTSACAELFDWLEPGELLAGPPKGWAADWKAADPDRW